MPLQVLVVEDDIPSMELIREVLISMKAEVDAFSESLQAVPLLEAKRFDGIFLDLQMPGLDGLELSRMIRASSANKTTPIIILTGHGERETMGKVFGAGGNFYLQKPIDRYKLIKLFRTAQGAMQDNRRRFARISVRTPVNCEGDGSPIKGDSANLSCGGILFDAGGSLAMRANVRLTFKLPTQHTPIRAQGTVVRLDKNGYAAVEFISISSGDKLRIRTLVEQELADEPAGRGR
jgi:CheY-like chemotaxis protein